MKNLNLRLLFLSSWQPCTPVFTSNIPCLPSAAIPNIPPVPPCSRIPCVPSTRGLAAPTAALGDLQSAEHRPPRRLSQNCPLSGSVLPAGKMHTRVRAACAAWELRACVTRPSVGLFLDSRAARRAGPADSAAVQPVACRTVKVLHSSGAAALLGSRTGLCSVSSRRTSAAAPPSPPSSTSFSSPSSYPASHAESSANRWAKACTV